jgi:alkylation response protein AidB-like acyl-CoA dehydrogenase
MDFSLTAEQEMLRDETRAFCEKELNREYVRWMDENCDFVPDELWQKMAALGHFEMTIPTEYGGLGLGSMEAMLLLEEVASASVAVALGVGAAVGFGAMGYSFNRSCASKLHVGAAAWTRGRGQAMGPFAPLKAHAASRGRAARSPRPRMLSARHIHSA